jgi:glycosyltransferase involved in cell wall biosynthesis
MDQNIEFLEEGYRAAVEADAITTISAHAKRDIVSILGIDDDNVFVTPLAAHSQYRRLGREQVRPILVKYELDQTPYILTIGTLEPRKNQRALIWAFKRLKEANPSLSHQLVLIGEKGWMWEPLFQAIDDCQLGSQVRWLNFVPFEEMPALLNGADLFVYPSLYEGFGLPPLEAMACGVPVIASNTTSLPEVVGDAGILVDPLDEMAIANAMERVLANRCQHGALARQGQERARCFSWKQTAELTLVAYEEAYRRYRDKPAGRMAHRNRASKTRDEVRQWVIDNSLAYALNLVGA